MKMNIFRISTIRKYFGDTKDTFNYGIDFFDASKSFIYSYSFSADLIISRQLYTKAIITNIQLLKDNQPLDLASF